MEFRNNEAIYLQIAGYASDLIMVDRWRVGEKVPSVRELAVELQVNPNTVVRAYEYLQNLQVIANKRGIGFFVTEDAKQHIKKIRKERFLKQDLPDFFKAIHLLDIGLEEIAGLYEEFKLKTFKQ